MYCVLVQLLTMLIPDVSLTSYCNCMQQSCSLMTPRYLFFEVQTTKGYESKVHYKYAQVQSETVPVCSYFFHKGKEAFQKELAFLVSLVEISWLPRLFTCPELRTSADASIAVNMLAKHVSPLPHKSISKYLKWCSSVVHQRQSLVRKRSVFCEFFFFFFACENREKCQQVHLPWSSWHAGETGGYVDLP